MAISNCFLCWPVFYIINSNERDRIFKIRFENFRLRDVKAQRIPQRTIFKLYLLKLTTNFSFKNKTGVVHPHTANITNVAIQELGWQVIPHPPYSPDLAPLALYRTTFKDFPLMKSRLTNHWIVRSLKDNVNNVGGLVNVLCLYL